MTRSVDDMTGGAFEIPATPPIPAFPEIDLGEKPSIEFMQACSDLDYRLTTGQEPPVAVCRICRATVTNRTICRECLYGPDEDTESENEVFETIWGPIEPQEQETNG